MLSTLEELAALRDAALVTVNDMNTGGVLLEDRLWAIPARVRTVALSGVRHGAALALATAQLPVGADEEEEELTADFTAATEAIMAATHAGDIVLAAFFEP